MFLKYYSENIRVPLSATSRENELAKILFAIDVLVFGNNGVQDYDKYFYEKDNLVLTAKSEGDLIEYRVGLVVQKNAVEVFDVVYSGLSTPIPTYTVIRHNNGVWVSKLLALATKESKEFVETLERFSSI